MLKKRKFLLAQVVGLFVFVFKSLNGFCLILEIETEIRSLSHKIGCQKLVDLKRQHAFK